MTGRLRLGVIPAAMPAASILTEAFAVRHPRAEIELRSMSSRAIQKGLDNFEIDGGMTYLDNEPLQHVRCFPLYAEHYVFACRSGDALIAPFRGCVLLFALPQSPLARPRNVIGGHVLSALVGLLVLNLVGDSVLAMGFGVGLAIAMMQLTGTVHPPAGGDPLVVILTGAGWSFLAVPILAGSLTLVLVAIIYHRLVSTRAYPD